MARVRAALGPARTGQPAWSIMRMQLLWPEETEPVELSDDNVGVWAVSLIETRASQSELPAILSAGEKSRAEQFRLDEPRRRFVMARTALRMILARYLKQPPQDIHVEFGPRGKPWVRNDSARAVHFNLAHSGNVALIAVAVGCEVGADIEQLRTVNHWQGIAQRYFHLAEVTQLRATKPALRQDAFLRCWTGKEAVLKALGVGLGSATQVFQVPVNQSDGTWIDSSSIAPYATARCWLQQLAPASNYLAAVACAQSRRIARCAAFRV
jgi:4'-phosphopantetheinyl transferase